MIDYIYDDMSHFQNSCPRMLNSPGYRPLITAVLCLSRGNLAFVRGVSAVCILMSLYFLASLFFTERRERLLFTLVGFHPVLAFPFFYASQISTSLTFFWAACLARLTFSGSHWAFVILLGMAGVLFRYEALYFYMIAALAIFLIKLSLGIQGRGLSVEALKATFSLREAFRFFAGVVAFLASSFLLGRLLRGLSSQMDILSVYSAGEVDFYPSSSHLFVQAYAILLYLKSFFLPVTANFFSPWYDWLLIHSNQGYQLGLGLSFVGLLSLASFYSARASTPRVWRAFCVGLALFLGIGFAVSIRIRHDWYFLSRAYLGSLFFLLVFYLALAPRWRWCLISYCIFSFVLALGLHYKDQQTFYSWESSNRGTHPYLMNLDKAVLKLDDREKIQYFMRPFDRVEPFGVLDQSVTARKYAYSNLKRAFFIAKKIGDRGSMEKIVSELRPSPIYVSTFVLMLAGEIVSPDQVAGQRKQYFCKTLRDRQHNPTFDGLLPFDVYSFCRVAKPATNQ